MTVDTLAGAGRVFVDTSVLVYVYDNDEPHKQQVASQALAEVGAERVVLSAQVLNEFVVTVTRKLARPLDDARTREAVEVLGQLEVVPVDAGLVAAGVLRSQGSQLSLWDALVVEAARRGSCEVLLTEDLHPGTDFDGVRVVNPFAG
ncbi:PIN domain-containing protein [Jiangella alba]|uniref:Ribonuclease VapC n=1 Tax=Jiangella alba TaxID=561176 RepID=A0A1H5P3V4_9ACTN|nr:PIN domain-containing protein [Jiangella alba]SEF08549.1 Predicted nucleic acid-binding protein, contains PIN domain [Jiangella alba]